MFQCLVWSQRWTKCRPVHYHPALFIAAQLESPISQSSPARSILITGCSSGIGHDAATTFHKQGWQVIATCRNADDCARLKQQGLQSFVLDYRDSTSVCDGAKQALDLCNGKIDILFNNGALAIPGLVEDMPRGAMQDIFAVNLFGQIELINQLLPSMRQAGGGYIINNSSVLGLVGMRYRGAYCATKFAMEGITDTLRLELAGSDIHIVLIEPGPITSRIRQNSVAHFERWINHRQSHQASRYREEMIPRLYQDSTTPDRFELPPSAVTNKLLKIVNSRKPRPRYYVTTPTHIVGTLKRLLSTRLLDRVLQR